jgi:GntR family transcriptional regulator
MVRDGLIERQRGRGSFVRAAEPEARACVTSLTEQVLRSGRTPTTDVLGVVVRPAGRFEEDDLPFAKDEAVARIERVRRIDGRPVALMRSFLPERHVPGVAAGDFASDGPAQSLLYVLEHRFGVLLDVGEETLLPAAAERRDAEALGIDVGTPVAVRICRIENAEGETTLYEEAIWCAPQTQPIQRFPAAVRAVR